MMPQYASKTLRFLLAVLIVTALFFFGAIAQRESRIAKASFLDIIRALVTVNPLSVEVSAPPEVEIGKVFKVEAEARNRGQERIENAKGEIFLPPPLGLILKRKTSIHEIGVIPGGKEKKIFWQVEGGTIGNYVISVVVSGELAGSLVSAEESTTVKIVESFLPHKPIFDFFSRLEKLLRLK